MSVIMAELNNTDIPPKTFVRQMTFAKAREKYGDKLHPAIEHLLEREMALLEGTGGFVQVALLINIIQGLKQKKSFGMNSIVAHATLTTYLLELTEINPLPPHHLCKKCGRLDFDSSRIFSCGADLPDKKCCMCGSDMIADGFQVPLETVFNFPLIKMPMQTMLVSERSGKVVLEELTRSTEKKALGLDDLTLVFWNRLAGVEETKESNQTEVVDSLAAIRHQALMNMPKIEIRQCLQADLFEKLADETGDVISNNVLADRKLVEAFFQVSFNDYLAIILQSVAVFYPNGNSSDLLYQKAYQHLVESEPTFSNLLETIAVYFAGDDFSPHLRPEECRLVLSREDLYLFFLHVGLEKEYALRIANDVRKGKGLRQSAEIDRLKLSSQTLEWINAIRYLPVRSWLVLEALMQLRLMYYRVNYPEAWERHVVKDL